MSEWQPIKTAPKDGSKILVYLPPREKSDGSGVWDAVYTVSHWYAPGRYWWDHSMSKPTHWMPLPAPPIQ